MVADELKEDVTTGVEVQAARSFAGFDAVLHGEVGRSFYTAVDDGAPEVGFGANVALSITRRGATRWTR